MSTKLTVITRSIGNVVVGGSKTTGTGPVETDFIVEVDAGLVTPASLLAAIEAVRANVVAI